MNPRMNTEPDPRTNTEPDLSTNAEPDSRTNTEPDPKKPGVLAFGGTTEGREIAEWLSARGTCAVTVSSLTEYGGSLVDGLPNVESLTGRMLPPDMEALIRARGFTCVIDATHPFATGISASIADTCATCDAPVVRVLREGEPEGPWVAVDSADDAARHAARAEGAVLLTTGSNDLSTYVQALPDFRERLFVRILPVAKSLAMADELGIPASHVIAMQGPFSKELNIALIREFGIKTLVTKASGKAGGFWEKAEAARECGIELVVIRRPLKEEGLSPDEAKRELAETYGL